MKKADKYPVPDQVKLSGRLSEFRDALQEEIQEIESNGQNSTLLVGGHSIEAKGSGFWYRFLVEYMPLLPADTPCKLTIGTEQYDVTVISSNENEIILSSKIKLPANIGKAKLENGSTVLMERLIKCIEDNADKANPAGDRMFTGSDGSVYPVKQLCTYNEIHYAEHSNAAQKSAVKSALENDITYIWGPPGTGKTTVISTIINELFEHERSVLIVSHTNTAVDGAIIKVAKAYSESHEGSQDAYPILRIGITSEGFPPEALLESHVQRLGEELFEQKELLEARRQVLIKEIEDIKRTLAKDHWLKNSNLPEIQGMNDIVRQLQKEKEGQEKQVEEAERELDKIVRAEPDGDTLLQLEEKYNSKRSALRELQENIDSLDAKLGAIERQRQAAEDEIKKHALYAELKDKIGHLMSAQFYKNKIIETKSAIGSLEQKKKLLTEKRDILQDSIHKYENKGSVAKIFASKATYEQHQRELAEVNQSLASNREALEQKQRLLEDYIKQLDELNLLLEKLHAVKPTKTVDYWKTEEYRLRQSLSEIKTRRSKLDRDKDLLVIDINAIEEKKKSNQAYFDSVKLIQRKIAAYKLNVTNTEKQIAQIQGLLSQRIAEEETLCEVFFHSDSNNVLDIIQELSSLNDEVYEELHSLDIEEKEQRKEVCEKEDNLILAELSDIQKKMAELEKQAIMNARIIGTTLAKSYLSDVLRERQFDTVILDEASMASIPALWCAAYLAEKNIVIVGDFLQLPPIVMANTEMAKKWLGRDIFDHSGMQEMAKKKNKNIRPDNFIMLNEQYRMEEDIANIANLYYGKKYTRLKSYDMSPPRVKDREVFYSWYSGKKTKDHIHLIDTESLNAWVTGIPQAKGHSRLNSFSAAVDVALAFKCLDKFIKEKLYEDKVHKGTKVLIVAPYKPHVTLLNKLIENEYRLRGISSEYNLVKAGTIHSFQGSEADIVIFDLVIDEPHWKANLFISDPDRNPALEKMFNVAVTRARFKLYVVGDFKYCQSRAKDNPLSDLLKYLIDDMKYIKVDAKKQLLPKMLTPPQSSIMLAGTPEAESVFVTESKFHDFFLSDVNSFKHNMIIYSPFMTEGRISMLLPAFYAAISQGKRIVVITRPLSERGKTEVSHYKQCEDGLRNIGVSILHKKGMHEKVILIDDEIIWTGSLNALSYTGNTGEVMERRKDTSKEKVIISSYVKILDIDYLVKALDSSYETKCPICGGEMLIAESEGGGIYWKCVTGDYSRNKDQQYPVDGILRCAKCDSPFVFAMKKQPRWVCTADSKHYQFLRKNDLKLPNMAALVSKADKKRVQEYFEELAKKKE